MRGSIHTLAAALLAAVALAGCGGSGENSFDTPTYPFSFDYPGGWTLSRAATSEGGGALRALSVALKEPYDQVTIMQYKLKKTLPRGANGFRPEINRIVARLTKQARGSAGKGRVVKYGGVPGYQYVLSYPVGGGVRLQSRMTFLFKGDNEFQIACQSSEKNREELERGCEKILGSLEFR